MITMTDDDNDDNDDDFNQKLERTTLTYSLQTMTFCDRFNFLGGLLGIHIYIYNIPSHTPIHVISVPTHSPP